MYRGQIQIKIFKSDINQNGIRLTNPGGWLYPTQSYLINKKKQRDIVRSHSR